MLYHQKPTNSLWLTSLDAIRNGEQNVFMDDRILELLELPRKLVHGEMDLEDCPHDGFFDSLDHQCIDCPQGPECQWLCNNDEFAALQQHSTDSLIKALDFAMVYVHGALLKWDHNPDNCACTVCQWHRNAKSVYDETLINH